MTAPAAPAPAGESSSPPLGLGRNVIALGVISLLNDVSSEMIVPVLPLFLTATLHASASNLGLVEGVAESAASLMRIGTGWISDRSGRRKPFLVAGYGLSVAAKAAFATVRSWPAVLVLRFTDRFGKAIRTPPRDALIADSVDPRVLGKAFGFHKGMDTLGAAMGPLLAAALLASAPGNFRRIFLVSAIPGLLALGVLVVFVRGTRRPPKASAEARAEAKVPFSPAFKRFLVVTGIFSLASSSLAFLLLYAGRVGFTPAQVPLIYFAYNIVYALLAMPIGTLSDRIGRRPILLAAYVGFALIYGLLAASAAKAAVIVAFLALGVQFALIEGSQRSLLAELVPPERRATAYGIYATVAGVALLPASALAGVLWDRFGPRVTFGADAALAALAAALFALLLPARRELEERHRARPA